MKLKTLLVMGMASAVVSAAVVPAEFSAANALQAASAQTQLPPALQAAINSGSAQAISQAIDTLSGGNPERKAALALQVAARAEQLVSINPANAMVAATVALTVVDNASVMDSNPGAAARVAATAARVAKNPNVIAISPDVVAQVALTAAKVAANPAVREADPSAAAQANADAQVIADNSSVIEVAPDLSGQVTAYASNSSGSTGAVQTPQNEGGTPRQPDTTGTAGTSEQPDAPVVVVENPNQSGSPT